MGELGDVLGEDFEKQYESKVQERRQKAQRVTSDTMKQICHFAINEGGFKGEEPRFTFDEGDIQHDVLLMQAPEKDIQKFRHKLGDSAVSLGMFHLDKLFSCAFNEGLVELVDKIEEGEYYLVVGRYQQKTEMKDGEERTYNNMSPVRGIAPIAKAKQMAEAYQSETDGSSVEEQAAEQTGSSDESSSSSGGVQVGKNKEVEDSDVIRVFQAVADGSPQVLKQVASGDSDALSKLTNVVNDNTSGKEVGIERVADLFEQEVDEIEGRHEEEEEEDDDGIDLGGLGGGDDDSSDDEEEEVEETTSTDDSSSDDEEGDPDDWF